MTYYVIKVIVFAALVVAISEVAKRSSAWGGILASLPLTSVLAIGWLYFETHDALEIAALARSTLWYVLPSLVLFLVLPVLLHAGRGFALSLAVALGATAVSYVIMVFLLRNLGANL